MMLYHTPGADRFQNAMTYYDKAIDIAEKYNMKYELYCLYIAKEGLFSDVKDHENQVKWEAKFRSMKSDLEAENKKSFPYAYKMVISSQNNNQSLIGKWGIIFLLAGILGIILLFLVTRASNKPKTEAEAKRNPKNSSHSPSVNSENINHLLDLVQNNDSSFYFKFLETFPNFTQKLLNINPKLTAYDLEFCALVKLNFNNKEIARFTNTTIRSVDSKKYRLRKKLNLSTEENIYVWMLNL
ncbi:helix-turn-helix transcriptional regulator [Chryseobacterium sp. MIQD13]|uniref:helix-turn-helix transcriptional regulator n=1 Tax=Chryseobacterium sp. MIQD13 TaxID=3422310 RepID=UPI003D27C77F